MGGQLWGDAELKELRKYFHTNITKLTLYKRLQNINPSRSIEAVWRKVRHYEEKGWTRREEQALGKLRTGYLDIEATHLKGNWGYILTWYIKPDGRKDYDFSIITKEEIFKEEFDKRVVRELLLAFNDYDIIYTHYGVDNYGFDIPFIRTRAFAHGLENLLPKYMEKFIADTWPIAKKKLKLHSNRLGTIAEAVGIRNVCKTPLSPDKWRLAAIGNKKALEYIALHNKRDVQLLERVHKKLKCIEKRKMTSI